MELTDEIWEAMGFKKDKCVGGFYRWYHNRYLGRDFYMNIKYHGSISGGRLSFDSDDKAIPKTLEQLNDVLIETIEQSALESGRSTLSYEIRNLLGLES